MKRYLSLIVFLVFVLILLQLFYMWRDNRTKPRNRIIYIDKSPELNLTSVIVSINKRNKLNSTHQVLEREANHNESNTKSSKEACSPNFPFVNTSNGVIVYTKCKIGGVWNPEDGWVSQQLQDFPRVVYHVAESNNETGPCLVKGKGKEAMGYLTFIRDHYDFLPEYVIFLHGHLHSWHSSEITKSIRLLKKPVKGYVNLNWDKEGGTCKSDVIDPKDEFNDAPRIFKRYWQATLGRYIGPIPPKINFHCCAQFAVSKERMRGRPKKFYADMIEWLENSPVIDFESSRLFEFSWHMIFGEEAEMKCQKFCDVFVCNATST